MLKYSVIVFTCLGLSSLVHANDWLFVPSKENKCNIKVFYDKSALKENKLIEKWDVSHSNTCDSQQKKQSYLIYESKLDCHNKQLTALSHTFYFKDGSKKKYEDTSSVPFEPRGTSKLLLDEACSLVNKP
ncbi:MAG: hypothetical protein QM666_03175 [Acinetobacter sp.]